MSVWLYCAFLLAVAAERLAELALSRRHQARLRARGIPKVAEPGFPWMVLTHAGVLVASALEVWLLARPFIPALAAAMGSIFLVATVLRVWVIRTMRDHWNVEVMASGPLGVVTEGPFRLIRHPNYLAVVLEILAIPLLHGAWLTALVFSIANARVLAGRLRVEEATLMEDARYRAEMAPKARFVPGLF